MILIFSFVKHILMDGLQFVEKFSSVTLRNYYTGYLSRLPKSLECVKWTHKASNYGPHTYNLLTTLLKWNPWKYAAGWLPATCFKFIQRTNFTIDNFWNKLFSRNQYSQNYMDSSTRWAKNRFVSERAPKNNAFSK